MVLALHKEGRTPLQTDKDGRNLKSKYRGTSGDMLLDPCKEQLSQARVGI